MIVMSTPTFSKLRGGLALALTVGAGMFIGTPSAFAQSEPGTITVIAPRTINTVGRSAIGAPIQDISMSRAVSYTDLDLRTPAGQGELANRITVAARDACDQLDREYPNGTPDRATCVQKARASAQGQIDRAIAVALQPPPAPPPPPAPAPEPAPPPPAPSGERG